MTNFPVNQSLFFPFAMDEYIAAQLLKLKKEYDIIAAVETGTYLGGTFRWLYDNFEKVYSCEINPEYYQLCCNLIFNEQHSTEMETYPGRIINLPDMGEMMLSNQNSVDFIDEIASQLDNRTLFFLDAHWYNYCPLLDELAAIARHKLRPAVIAIHDFVTDHPDQLGYDSYQSQAFTLEWIKPAITEIYGQDWTHAYNTPETSMGEKRGIIYITPKPPKPEYGETGQTLRS